MWRQLGVLMMAASSPAWAVGERVLVKGDVELKAQLSQAFCISLDCASHDNAAEYQIVGKRLKDRVEVTVKQHSQTLATFPVALNDNDRIGSTDLYALATKVYAAIEAPKAVKTAVAKKTRHKKIKGKLLARRH